MKVICTDAGAEPELAHAPGSWAGQCVLWVGPFVPSKFLQFFYGTLWAFGPGDPPLYG